jgi:hypothetical protein
VTNRKGIYELVVGAASKTWNSYAQPPRMGFINLRQAVPRLQVQQVAPADALVIGVGGKARADIVGIYELVVGAASKTWNSYAQPPRMGFITLSGAF